MIVSQKLISFTLLFLGLFLVAQVTAPIVTYKLWELNHLQENNALISPYPKLGPEVLGISVQTQNSFPAFVSSLKRQTPLPFGEFRISIPRLRIKETKVFVDSNELDRGLVHLPGSALPGERGNVFISGHSSVLFTNNFSRLQNMKVGDEIKVAVGGTNLLYKVLGIKVVDPADTSVISPPDSGGRYLSLMTCVPPGLNFKRLIVLAELI